MGRTSGSIRRRSTMTDGVDEVDEVDALFDEVIDRTLTSLPPEFAGRLGSVAIVVEDDASPDQLATVGARGLYGLYEGVPRTHCGAENIPVASKITLFRGTLVRGHPSRARLARAIEDTLLHEIAHHFGISDSRLRELRRT
jgi:predicted Zn-dependent protease with MMP-like domain